MSALDFVNVVCLPGQLSVLVLLIIIIILYYAIYGSTHKYKKS